MGRNAFHFVMPMLLLLGISACRHYSHSEPMHFQQKLANLANEFKASSSPISRQAVQRFLEHDFVTPVAGYAEAESYLQCPANLPKVAADAILYFSYTLDEKNALSTTSRQRLQEVERLYRLGLAKNIILTGGAGRRPLEDKVARAQLIARGVPAEVIWMEGKSTNTWQNLLHGLQLARAQGFQSVIFVSSPYHLPRIVRYFERLQKEQNWNFSAYWSAYDPKLDRTDFTSASLDDRDDQILKEIYALLRDQQRHGYAFAACAATKAPSQ